MDRLMDSHFIWIQRHMIMDILLVQAIPHKMNVNIPLLVPGVGASLVVVQHGDQPLLGSGKIQLMVSVLLSMECRVVVPLFMEYIMSAECEYRVRVLFLLHGEQGDCDFVH